MASQKMGMFLHKKVLEAEPGAGHGAEPLGQSTKGRTPGIHTVIWSPERPPASAHHGPGAVPGWDAEAKGEIPEGSLS